jgi:hypothetical protein
MDRFNKQLQEYLDKALRAAATDVLVQRGGVERVVAHSKITQLSALRGELAETKELMTKMREETKQELHGTKLELTLLTEAQERTNGRMGVIEAKMDVLLELLTVKSTDENTSQ